MKTVLFLVMLLIATPAFAHKTEREFDEEMLRLDNMIKKYHPEVIWVDCESPVKIVEVL